LSARSLRSLVSTHRPSASLVSNASAFGLAFSFFGWAVA
jgi:hypothetical protein